MQDLQNWISRYLVECKYQKGLDPKTLKAYRIDLEQFSTLIARNSLELTREGLMKYITDLHQQYKPRTVKRKIASVKAFCSYLEFEELVSENPFSRLRLKLNPPQILPRTISLPTIEAILTAAYRARETAGTFGQQKLILRDIAVLELLFATGVRVSELCALQCGDVRLEVFSDLPGLQFYSGNYLNGSEAGKGGCRYGFRGGLCLEPQYYPAAPNYKQFPAAVLKRNEIYQHTIKLKFCYF